jgi:hypothetical protein
MLFGTITRRAATRARAHALAHHRVQAHSRVHTQTQFQVCADLLLSAQSTRVHSRVSCRRMRVLLLPRLLLPRCTARAVTRLKNAAQVLHLLPNVLVNNELKVAFLQLGEATHDE